MDTSRPVFAAALLTLAGVAGCATAPIATESTNNPQIEYEVLMERRGCEVGRFTDRGQPVYVTVCPEAGTSAVQSSWVEQCGADGKGTPSCWRVVDRQQIQVRGDFSPVVGDAR